MIVIFMMIMLLNIMMMIMIAKTHGFDYGTDDDNRHKNHLREFVCETHVILAQAREEGEPKRPTARGG